MHRQAGDAAWQSSRVRLPDMNRRTRQERQCSALHLTPLLGERFPEPSSIPAPTLHHRRMKLLEVLGLHGKII